MRALTLTILMMAFGFGCASSRQMRADLTLQTTLEKIESELREKFVISTEQCATGVLDLRSGAVGMTNPDRIEYAASVAKIGILLAWFETHSLSEFDARVRRELGLMVKASSNEMATRFSEEMGLRRIQEILNERGFYDASKGGGIWVGKHYGKSGERIADPVGGNSHAATVRQLLRFYWMLDRGELVSKEASAAMQEIFSSPEIAHDQIKFVKGLAGREVKILRKWGSWENWLHDSAIVQGPGRRYVLVGLLNHPKGDEFLEEFAARIDDAMIRR
jgi:beta-lactamase class A